MRSTVTTRKYKEYNSDSETFNSGTSDSEFSDSGTSDSEFSDSGTSDSEISGDKVTSNKMHTKGKRLIHQIVNSKVLDDDLTEKGYNPKILIEALGSTCDKCKMKTIAKYISDINVTQNGILVAETVLTRNKFRFHSLLEFFLNNGLDLSRIKERDRPYMYLLPYSFNDRCKTDVDHVCREIHIEMGKTIVLLGGFADVVCNSSKLMRYVQCYDAASLPSYLNFIPEKYWIQMGPTDDPLENKSSFNANLTANNPRSLWDMSSVADYHVWKVSSIFTSLSTFVSPSQYLCTGLGAGTGEHPVLLESIRIFFNKEISQTRTHETRFPIDIIEHMKNKLGKADHHSLKKHEMNYVENIWACIQAFDGDYDESKIIRLTQEQKKFLYFMHLVSKRREEVHGFQSLHTELIIKIAHMALNV